jgi:hypothetical protein
MDKMITARFFRVAAADGTPPLSETFETIHDLSFEDRLQEVQSSDVRLERLQHRPNGTMIYGDFVRLQADNKPGMASKTTAEVPLNLPVGHALTHTAAFGYDRERSILCLQTNRSGLSTKNLSTYLAYFIDRGGYSFVPLARKGALMRLSSVRVRQLQVKIGSPDDLSDLDDETKPLKRT